ncbi:MAG: hypothetical protein ABSH11_03320 [Verrucomicrobiota bacterium]|jgi:hypothetical protein
MKTLKVLFLCSAAFLLPLIQSPAQDLLLNQYAGSLAPPADMAGLSLTASYAPSNQTFHITASPDESVLYEDAAGNYYWVDQGSFSVTANIDSSGYLSAGSLSVTGILKQEDTVVYPQGDILTGTLVVGPQGSPVGSAYDYTTAFGAFEDGGDFSLIDFTFNVTGGALAGDFGGVGSSAIISFSSWQESGPIGDWTMSWNNSGGGMCDVFPVPEPTTAGCFLLGLGALACCQHFSKNRRSDKPA